MLFKTKALAKKFGDFSNGAQIMIDQHEQLNKSGL